MYQRVSLGIQITIANEVERIELCGLELCKEEIEKEVDYNNKNKNKKKSEGNHTEDVKEIRVHHRDRFFLMLKKQVD